MLQCFVPHYTRLVSKLSTADPNYVNIVYESISPPSYKITNKQGAQASNPFSDRPKTNLFSFLV